MITEGEAAIPLETTRCAFRNQEKSKQRSAIVSAKPSERIIRSYFCLKNTFVLLDSGLLSPVSFERYDNSAFLCDCIFLNMSKYSINIFCTFPVQMFADFNFYILYLVDFVDYYIQSRDFTVRTK